MELGELVRRGTGTVTSDNISIKGDISIQWNIRGIYRKNNLILELITDIDNYKQMPFAPWTLYGQVEGKPIVATNIVLLSQGGNIGEKTFAKFTFSVTEIRIGALEPSNRVDYYIPNCMIGYDDLQKIGKKHVVNKTTIEVIFKGTPYILSLEGLNDSVEKRSEYIDNKATLISTKLAISRKDSTAFDFEESNRLADCIMELITFIYGGRVTWVSSVAYQNNSEKILMVRDADFSRINPSRGLLRLERPRVLSNYIVHTFDNYSSFEERYRKTLIILISSIHFSMEKLVFPNPFTTLGSAIEDFVQAVLPEIETHYLDGNVRKNLFPNFSVWIKDHIIPLITIEEDRDDFRDANLRQKLSGLLQRNLRTRISAALRRFKVGYDTDVIRVFVQKRNAAAHGTYIFEGLNDYLAWSSMAAYFEKAILNELGYIGEYSDWSTSPPQWKNSQ